KKLPGHLTTQPAPTSANRPAPGLQQEEPARWQRPLDFNRGHDDEDYPDYSRIRRMPLASLGARLGGALLDGFVSLIFLGPGYFLVINAGEESTIGLAILAVGALFLLVIQVSLLSMHGQSIGKKMVGTRIVNFEDGKTAGFVRAFLLRSFVPGLIGAIP